MSNRTSELLSSTSIRDTSQPLPAATTIAQVAGAVGSSEEVPRPKKKYKSAIFFDRSLPASKQDSKRASSQQNVILTKDMKWMLAAVNKFDKEKDSSNKLSDITSFEIVL
jgi:hypothetical protein